MEFNILSMLYITFNLLRVLLLSGIILTILPNFIFFLDTFQVGRVASSMSLLYEYVVLLWDL